MKAKQLSDPGEKSYALVLRTGEEVMAALTAFAQEHRLHASHLPAIGAFSDVTLGYFAWDLKRYTRIPLHEQVEVLSLVGDIVLEKGRPKIHAHVVVGKADGTAHGGHLLEAHVRPTLEVILMESPRYLMRAPDPESGLALIDLDLSPDAGPPAGGRGPAPPREAA